MRYGIIVWCFLTATLFGMMAACSEQPVQTGSVQCQGGSCEIQKYAMGSGDVLHISVWKDAEMDRTVTVRPDGMISYPLVNDIQATGLTPMQLQKKLAEELQKYISNPVVSVVVKEVHSFQVSVLGNVTKPGRYQLQGEVTVLDVLAQAGGLNEFASQSGITVLRNENNTRERISFDYDLATSKRGGQKVLYVHPGDIILVP
ncbi:MAG: polysaccharide biosynthesis/export family protein [Sciscionella sp.]